MKTIKYKIFFVVGLLLVLIWSSKYIEDNRSYNLEEMSEFLAMCGDFVQSGSSDSRPGTWDYFIVLVSAIVVLFTLWYSIKYLIKPNEQVDHIKFKILEDAKED